ncbi:topoisomerase II-associated protein PAT1 [Blastocladiella britannica]|nr:topoisomerase II-associated protein PAT1 [Blastocladiella britannica]
MSLEELEAQLIGAHHHGTTSSASDDPNHPQHLHQQQQHHHPHHLPGAMTMPPPMGMFPPGMFPPGMMPPPGMFPGGAGGAPPGVDPAVFAAAAAAAMGMGMPPFFGMPPPGMFGRPPSTGPHPSHPHPPPSSGPMMMQPPQHMGMPPFPMMGGQQHGMPDGSGPRPGSAPPPQQPQQPQMMHGLPVYPPEPGMEAVSAQGMSPEAQERQIRAIKRARREARIRESSRFNGIMSQYEKDLIARLQIGQLVSADPMTDDYYFQMHAKTMAEMGAAAAAATDDGASAEGQGVGSTDGTGAVENGGGVSASSAVNRMNERSRRGYTGNSLLRRAANQGTALQEQIDRIVHFAKKKSTKTQGTLSFFYTIGGVLNLDEKIVALEGALGGTVSLRTTKNPRQRLHIDAATPGTSADVAAAAATPGGIPPAHNSSTSSNGTTGSTAPTTPTATRRAAPLPPAALSAAARKRVAKLVEDVYDAVIDAEAMFTRQPSVNGKRTVMMDDDGDEMEMTYEDDMRVWDAKCAVAREHVWAKFVGDHVEPHAAVQILSTPKGKRLWPRLVRQLDVTGLTQLILAVFGHAQQLDSVRSASIPALFAAPQLFPGLSSSRPTVASLVQFVDSVESFMHYVVPALVEFVAEAPWPIIASCLTALLDRNDVVRLGSAKAGLALLTMLVSRAEILNQSGYAGDAEWPALYMRVFAELQGHYLAFFPVVSFSNLPTDMTERDLPALLVPPGGLPDPADVPGAPTPADLLEFYLTDDAHVWQFLASLAVAASVEQQTMLVTEVRERILSNVVAGELGAAGTSSSTAADKAERAVYNVNLFLHALGLDASQIQTAAAG